ncbi:MAG: hypothetical protein J0M33_15220 [Anaerolineae bacterium]|nr:hypothetical protein [Anaerolineae bacterium]
MWGYLAFEPAAAFSLRPSNTTANGGKSLVCPTPYAIKMALLDRLIRLYGVESMEALFPVVRDKVIYLRPALATAVNRTFQKVLRGWDGKAGEWTPTIAQREYCFQAGALTLAINLDADQGVNAAILDAFTAINYFGRRGSFLQLIDWMQEESSPEGRSGFVNLCQASGRLMSGGFLQRMDNMRADATFDEISIFSPRGDGGRESYTVILPYQLRHHGFNHTIYALPEGRE